jgi:hypothetical protein
MQADTEVGIRTPTESYGTDEAELARMGYKQELR